MECVAENVVRMPEELTEFSVKTAIKTANAAYCMKLILHLTWHEAFFSVEVCLLLLDFN